MGSGSSQSLLDTALREPDPLLRRTHRKESISNTASETSKSKSSSGKRKSGIISSTATAAIAQNARNKRVGDCRRFIPKAVHIRRSGCKTPRATSQCTTNLFQKIENCVCVSLFFQCSLKMKLMPPVIGSVFTRAALNHESNCISANLSHVPRTSILPSLLLSPPGPCVPRARHLLVCRYRGLSPPPQANAPVGDRVPALVDLGCGAGCVAWTNMSKSSTPLAKNPLLPTLRHATLKNCTHGPWRRGP